MWSGFLVLLSYSMAMGIASFLAGSLPLSLSLSPKHSRFISSVGTGVLVGTCLIVIIPEGIETLYSATLHHSELVTDKNESQSKETSLEQEPHAWVGLCLIIGFVLMYIIDEVPKHVSKHVTSNHPLHISLADLAQGPHRAGSPSGPRVADEEAYANTSFRNPSAIAQMPESVPAGPATTIGLVIHAAADGIALAASSFIQQASTGFVVFVALMIHKAPAAFGLTSVLLKQGFSKRQARAHLLVFSLAAPAGALATWAMVNIIVGGNIRGEESTTFATGLLLIFSGGTFLYVAMHTMQDGDSLHQNVGQDRSYINSNTYTGETSSSTDISSTASLTNTLLTLMGMLLPLLAQAGHAH